MNSMSEVKHALERPSADPFWDQNRASRDEVRPAATDSGLRAISGVDWLFYGVVAAISLGIGIVNALSAAQDAVWRGSVYDLRTPLFWEMSSIVTIIAVAPVLFVTVRRMPHVSRWPLRLGVAVA